MAIQGHLTCSLRISGGLRSTGLRLWGFKPNFRLLRASHFSEPRHTNKLGRVLVAEFISPKKCALLVLSEFYSGQQICPKVESVSTQLLRCSEGFWHCQLGPWSRWPARGPRTLGITHRLHSISFLRLPHRILSMNHKKELLLLMDKICITHYKEYTIIPIV